MRAPFKPASPLTLISRDLVRSTSVSLAPENSTSSMSQSTNSTCFNWALYKSMPVTTHCSNRTFSSLANRKFAISSRHPVKVTFLSKLLGNCRPLQRVDLTATACQLASLRLLPEKSEFSSTQSCSCSFSILACKNVQRITWDSASDVPLADRVGTSISCTNRPVSFSSVRNKLRMLGTVCNS